MHILKEKNAVDAAPKPTPPPQTKRAAEQTRQFKSAVERFKSEVRRAAEFREQFAALAASHWFRAVTRHLARLARFWAILKFLSRFRRNKAYKTAMRNPCVEAALSHWSRDSPRFCVVRYGRVCRFLYSHIYPRYYIASLFKSGFLGRHFWSRSSVLSLGSGLV